MTEADSIKKTILARPARRIRKYKFPETVKEFRKIINYGKALNVILIN